MASTYSPSLRIELIGTGDQPGLWGDTTNNNLGGLIEQAITGYQSVSMTDTDYTLTSLNGSVDQARNAVIEMTSSVSLTTARNVIIPSAEKVYVVKNSTTGGQAIVVKTASGTGISVPNGESVFVYCNATNVYQCLSTLANIIATGSVTLGDASGDTVTFNAGTITLAQGTATQVMYLNGSKVVSGSNNMVFDGTKLTLAGLKDSALTAGRVTYATTSGELTDSASMTFDGTTFSAPVLTATTSIQSTAIVPRATALTDATSVTFNCATSDLVTQANTQAAGTLTINAPTGTPVNGQKLVFRLTCTNAQTLSWNSAFAGSTDLNLPATSTGGGKTDYMGFMYNSTAAKWQMLSKVFGF